MRLLRHFSDSGEYTTLATPRVMAALRHIMHGAAASTDPITPAFSIAESELYRSSQLTLMP